MPDIGSIGGLGVGTAGGLGGEVGSHGGPGNGGARKKKKPYPELTEDIDFDKAFIDNFGRGPGLDPSLITEGFAEEFQFEPQKTKPFFKRSFFGAAFSGKASTPGMLSPSQYRDLYGFAPENIDQLKEFQKSGLPSSESEIREYQRERFGRPKGKMLGGRPEEKQSFEGIGAGSAAANLKKLQSWYTQQEEGLPGQFSNWEKRFGQYLGSEGTLLAARYGAEEVRTRRETLLSGE